MVCSSTLRNYYTLRNAIYRDRIGLDGGRAGRLMPKIVPHRVRLWWDDFWESDNFFITVILRPIILIPVLLLYPILIPLGLVIVALKWVYKNVLPLKIAGVSLGWYLLPIAFFILLYQLYHHVFKYW